jgi:hypothetical protein
LSRIIMISAPLLKSATTITKVKLNTQRYFCIQHFIQGFVELLFFTVILLLKMVCSFR